MKILAPINAPQEVERIISAGADELYCGVIDKNWKKKYASILSPNHRLSPSASLAGFHELIQVVECAHALKTKVKFCLNGLYRDEMRQEALKAIEAGVDGIVAGEIATILMLRESASQAEITASSTLNALNSATLDFFKGLGIKSVILPRHMSIKEIKDLVSIKHDLSFEVFIKNEGCFYCDGICSFSHSIKGSLGKELKRIMAGLIMAGRSSLRFANSPKNLTGKRLNSRLKYFLYPIRKGCTLRFDVFEIAGDGKKQKTQFSQGVEAVFNSQITFLDASCGACAMLDFIKFPQIVGYKIVGRGAPLRKKIKDILFIKRARAIALDQSEEKEVRYQKIKNIFKEIYGFSCCHSCYYSLETSR